MIEEEDVDITAVMGFGAFSGTKKRKLEQASSPQPKFDTSGANSTQLGVRTKRTDHTESGKFAQRQPADQVLTTPAQLHSVALSSKFHADETILPQSTSNPGAARPLPRKSLAGDLDSNFQNDSSTEVVSFGGMPISRAELNALKFGLTNERGDHAYFLPNFVEDPWAGLVEAPR